MLTRIRTALVLTFIAVPGAVSAQQAQPPEEIQKLLQEAAQIQQQLVPVQQQALGDEAVQQGQQRAADAIRGAMIEADPSLEAKLDRVEAIMVEAQQAQSTGDQQAIAALTQEIQQLQPGLQAAQTKALEKPEVQTEVEAFEKQLKAKMVELDPQSKALLDRLGQIEVELERAAARQG